MLAPNEANNAPIVPNSGTGITGPGPPPDAIAKEVKKILHKMNKHSFICLICMEQYTQ